MRWLMFWVALMMLVACESSDSKPNSEPSSSTETLMDASGVRVVMDESCLDKYTGEPQRLCAVFEDWMPSDWLAVEQGEPRYEITLANEHTILGTCEYTDGTLLTRARDDMTAKIQDRVDNTVVATKVFEGGVPDPCPATIRGGVPLGSEPSPNDFYTWLLTTMDGHAGIPPNVFANSFTVANAARPRFSPDGRYLSVQPVVLNVPPSVQVLIAEDEQNFRPLFSISDAEHPQFSADSRWLVVTQTDEVTVWDLARQEVTYRMGYPNVADAVISPDGTQIAAISVIGKNMQLWDVATEEYTARWEITSYEGNSTEMMFSPSGQELLLNLGGATLYLWNVDSQEQVWTTEAHWMVSTSFSPDGQALIGIDPYIEDDQGHEGLTRWDMATKTRDILPNLPEIQNERVVVRGMFRTLDHQFDYAVYTPDGRYIVTLLTRAGSQGLVQVWDAAEWTEVARFSVPKQHQPQVTISPDSHWVVTANVGTISFWDLSKILPQ